MNGDGYYMDVRSGFKTYYPELCINQLFHILWKLGVPAAKNRLYIASNLENWSA